MSKPNTSGVKGVCLDKARNYWKARVQIEKEQVTLLRNKDFFEVVCSIKSFEAKQLTEDKP